MILDNITISYIFNGVGYTLNIGAGLNHNLSYDIAEAMRRVIEDSGANLQIIINEFSQYLPQEYSNNNQFLN